MAMKMFLTLFRRPSQGANLSESIEMITSKERHAPGTFEQKLVDCWNIFQGTNISHHGNRKIIFKSTFGRGYVSSQEGMIFTIFLKHPVLGAKPQTHPAWRLNIFFPEILGIPFFTFNFSMVIFSFALTSNWRRENKHLTLANIFPFAGGLTFTTWIRWTYSSSGIGVAFFDGQKNPRLVTQLGMAKPGRNTWDIFTIWIVAWLMSVNEFLP